jgi:hypothetical protein
MKVLTIQDEERRRIARDLHDGVGQTLTGALMAVSQASSCPEPLPTGCQSGLRDPFSTHRVSSLVLHWGCSFRQAKNFFWESIPG